MSEIETRFVAPATSDRTQQVRVVNRRKDGWTHGRTDAAAAGSSVTVPASSMTTTNDVRGHAHNEL